MPDLDSAVVTKFSNPSGLAVVPGATIQVSDQYSVSVPPNTSTPSLTITDELSANIPQADVVVNNGGSYNAGIITWTVDPVMANSRGTVSFGDDEATITIPSDYAQPDIVSIAEITPLVGDVNPGDNESMDTINVVCFCTGTLIRTTRGECAVEDLVVGDVAVTASGETRPIVWVGHRDLDCRAQPDLHPVRVAAHAFGTDLPSRDLTLSPGHLVLVGADADNGGGHLVPIMCLINGTTICRVAVDHVTYWHVELDAHDILLAEDLPTESYLDWGDRAFFTEGADHRLANPDFVVPGLAGRCRPVALDGPVVEAAQRLLEQMFVTRLSKAAAWPNVQNSLLALF